MGQQSEIGQEMQLGIVIQNKNRHRDMLQLKFLIDYYKLK
jgi:hypothetical protein